MTQIENVEEPPKAPGIAAPEHQNRRALTYPLEVIVSPLKAFKEIGMNPSVIGLILIFGLFMLLSGGQEYVRASKIVLESTQSVTLLYYDSFISRFAVVLIRSFYGLFLNWITFAGVMFLLLRVFNEKPVPLRPFLIVVGYTFSILILYVAVSSVLVSTLPQVVIPLDKWTSQSTQDMQYVAQLVNNAWGPAVAYSLITALSYIFQFWLMLLGAVALHVSIETKWAKAALISIVAYLASIILTGLLSTLF